MKFTRLIAITALFSISGSAKSTVLRGSNTEITLDESPRDKHMPAEDQRFLNGCDPKCFTWQFPMSSCEGVDQSKVGCGSCRGDLACRFATGTIGKGSCFGYMACANCLGEEDSCDQATANIGDGSCLTRLSCFQAGIQDGKFIGHVSHIGTGSCSASYSCYKATSLFILDNSCNGPNSCNQAAAQIGRNSCNGKSSCTGATGIIADDKCNKDNECANRNHGDSCMAASTGFTKVDKLHGTVEIKELQHLEVGDTIKGVNENKIEVDDCEVVSVSTQGNGTVFGNYTSDHYVLSADDNNTVAHGEDGEEENVEVFQVLSSCPINVDESGKKTTFSICGKVLYDGGPMPWSVYLKIHGIMFKLVKESGVRDLSAFRDLDDAIQRLPGLCISGLTCAEEGDCGEFEAKMMDFISHDLVTDARKKVYDAFHHLGDASKEGSISFMVSKGLSGATASE